MGEVHDPFTHGEGRWICVGLAREALSSPVDATSPERATLFRDQWRKPSRWAGARDILAHMVGRPLETRTAPRLILALLSAACGSSSSPPAPPAPMDTSALMDSASCQTCHPAQYQQWAGSMHAYATDDPVFRAMNSRAQRESNNRLGTFCVKCHAPMAVRTGMTDGTNLDSLPAAVRGVTCYFCHSITEVTDTHNAPLTLDVEGNLYGNFADPLPGVPHSAGYSRFLDGATNESAQACGSCHDIVNLQGAHVERTFAEWRATAHSQTPSGRTCAQCHMPASSGFASETPPNKIRQVHDHTLAGVDLALGPFPDVPDRVRLARTPQREHSVPGPGALTRPRMRASVRARRERERRLFGEIRDEKLGAILDDDHRRGAPGHSAPHLAMDDRLAAPPCHPRHATGVRSLRRWPGRRP